MTDKPRSIDQHRRFFGLVRALFLHWPEAMEFQPDNEDHLRAYLLVKAGYRSIREFSVEGDATEFARLVPVVSALMLHKYCWAWADGNSIKVCAPESTRFDKLSHKDACKVYDKVDEFVRTLGIDPDQILKEHERAA